MATKTKKAPARKAPAKTEKKDSVGRNSRIETPTKATFGVDDKRAQYARLVVFNFGVKEKSIPKDKDVNSASTSQIESAGKALTGGNLLHGPDGLKLITDLSKAGAEDEKVAKRGLTSAYAAEVRPFIRKLMFSDSFGRRQGQRKKKESKAPAKKKAAKEQPEAGAKTEE